MIVCNYHVAFCWTHVTFYKGHVAFCNNRTRILVHATFYKGHVTFCNNHMHFAFKCFATAISHLASTIPRCNAILACCVFARNTREFARFSLSNMAESNSQNANSANSVSSTSQENIQSSLAQTRDIIVQLIDGVTNSPSFGSCTPVLNPSPARNGQQRSVSTNVSTPLITNLHNRALEEHRRLFGFSAKSIGSYATPSSGKRNRGKTGKTGGCKGAKKPKVATWTHAFVCLAKNSQVSLPSPQERYKLKCVGLGEKKITVEVKDSGFEELYNTLLEEFPLLEDVGGIELMRTGFGSKSKTLEVIPTPYGSTTYNIVYLGASTG